MFKNAVREYSDPTTTGKPLQSKLSALNSAKAPVETNKRKFDRTMSNTSSLGALHQAVIFDENDFDDDADLVTDLGSPTPQSTCTNITYPSLSRAQSHIEYPTLPKADNTLATPHPPASGAPVPWSSSPPEHFLPPAKRRALPWQKVEIKATPLSKTKPEPTYAWNKTASAMKEEQKELRRRNKSRHTAIKGQGQEDGAKNSSEKKVSPFFLSEEQKGVLSAVVDQGKSVFFTGSAGTGKSVLMREIIRQLRRKYHKEPDRIAVTASTGLAACNIEGVTLHSFAGIGLAQEATPELLKKIRKNAKAKTRWMRTKVLIVDEVSMVDGALFDKLESIARSLKNNGRPFGGIQIVVTGDFFQLPPVPGKDERGRELVAKFAFDATTWNTVIEHTILLSHIFRQRDPTFAGMLNEMRLGKLSQESINAFRKLARPLEFEDSLEATELFPTRKEVDRANLDRMNMLSGQPMKFTAVDSGVMTDVERRDKFLDNCMAQKEITLKKGAQVMLIKNMEETLVNGSLGKVIAFMDETMFDWYTRHEDEYIEAQADDTSDEERMSKAKKKLRTAVYNAEASASGSSTRQKWPLVRFTLPDNTERTLLCMPETWKTELPNGEIQAQRAQIPLILAWALSIHKAQGQTLERVKVDLGKVFEKGQAYVALSRATSQAGLQVTRFQAKSVMVHSRVMEFYAGMVGYEEVLGKKKEEESETKEVVAKKEPQPQQPIPVDSDEESSYMYG